MLEGHDRAPSSTDVHGVGCRLGCHRPWQSERRTQRPIDEWRFAVHGQVRFGGFVSVYENGRGPIIARLSQVRVLSADFNAASMRMPSGATAPSRLPVALDRAIGV